MFRKPVALLVTLYAIAFAFAAMAVVRWPTLMMFVVHVFRNQTADLSGFDWRGVGLHYGAPYLAAAIFYQISAFALATRQHGAVTAFVFGTATGFPAIFVLDLRPGWMAAPTQSEWAIVWIAGATLLVLGAVWDLRRREVEAPKAVASASAAEPAPVEMQAPSAPAKRRTPPPAGLARMVAIQRRQWAQEGRRARERRGL